MSIFVLALVLGKVNPETFLRVCNSLHVDHGNLEFVIAKSTDSHSRDCSESFDQPKIAFLHEQQFPTGGIRM